MSPSLRAAHLLFLLSLAAPAAAQDGAALYAAYCASCHDAGGAARVPPRAVIAALTADRIEQALDTGLMREQGAALSAAERRAVAMYLSTRPGAAAGATTSTTCSGATGAFGPRPGTDWNGWGAGLANHRFQRRPGLEASQVPGLTLRWAFGFEGETSAATQPTVVGGRVFVGSASGRVYSLGLQDGCIHWVFRAEAGVRNGISVGETGAAGGPLAFFGDVRANVYAVDAGSGELRWKRRVEEHRAARITGSPVLHKGRLYVPVSSIEEATSAAATYSCCTFRGSVVALDAATGEERWRTHMIPEAPRPSGKNRAGTQLYGPAGAAVWHAPTIDEATGSIYLATGDGYTAPAAPTTDAVVALDLDTGAMKWFRQMTEGDSWNMACGTPDPANCPEVEGPDFDFGQPPILVTLGGGRRALVVGQKSGKVHGLDPDARGRVLWSVQVGRGGMLGGFEWGSASDGEYVYTPLSDLAFRNQAQLRGGLDPTAGGGLFALRPADGTIAWSAASAPCTGSCPSPAQPAPPSVIPGAVFAGSLDGFLRAYSTADGKVIWAFDTAREFTTVNGVTAAGGSIDVGGPAIAEGMVLTTSGYGTWGGKGGNVLLAFGVATR